MAKPNLMLVQDLRGIIAVAVCHWAMLRSRERLGCNDHDELMRTQT